MSLADAQRLRAAGHEVMFSDDRRVPLVYDFAAWLILEERIGSLNAVSRALQWLPGSKLLTNIGILLTAGVAHSGMTEDAVRSGFLVDEVQNYQTAIEAAVTEAFPPEEEGEGKGQAEAMTASNGSGSTTSPPSTTTEPTLTSGG